MMNKILMGEGKNLLNSGEYFIEYNKEIEIDINGEVIINSNSNSNLTLNITNNSNLKFYNLDMIKENRCIIINVYDNVELDYNLALINTGKNKCNVKVNILGNNSSVNIKVRVLNTDKQSKIDIICDGNINIKTIDNEFVEDIKGLILSSDHIKISPNMDVSTNLVMANHLVTVGSFNIDELFYLKSRGLSELKAKKLLVESFIKNILPEVLWEYVNLEVINSE